MATSYAPEIGRPLTGLDSPILWPWPIHQANGYVPSHREELKAKKLRSADERAMLRAGESLCSHIVFDSVTDPLHDPRAVQFGEPGNLSFESRFESGNLRRAVRVSRDEYDLLIRPDLNTKSHTQWWYFSVDNTRKGVPVKFNITNHSKPDSLFNQGMQPVMLSLESARRKSVGWHRCGDRISYFKNGPGKQAPSTLTFTVTFEYDRDTVFFAHSYPYTYTDLQRLLLRLKGDPKTARRFRRRPLCRTLSGNYLDLITITSPAPPLVLRARRVVVLTARVHPGETVSSWMMAGVLKFLTGESLDAKILRDQFIFKIVPMLNPDGVICGNYRCSLAGCDLNRQWLTPSKNLHPPIWHVKQLIHQFQTSSEVFLFCDLHGHSRKFNVFLYGNEPKKASRQDKLRARVFPRLLWSNAVCFSYNDCSFQSHPAKDGCGRVVVGKHCGVANSFTLEASFAGANFGPLKGLQFNTSHLEAMGHYLCSTILDFSSADTAQHMELMHELSLLHPVGPEPAEKIWDDLRGGKKRLRRRKSERCDPVWRVKKPQQFGLELPPKKGPPRHETRQSSSPARVNGLWNIPATAQPALVSILSSKQYEREAARYYRPSIEVRHSPVIPNALTAVPLRRPSPRQILPHL